MHTTSDAGVPELLANLNVPTIVLIALALTFLRLVLLSLKVTTPPGRPQETHPAARSLAEILELLIIAGVLVFLIIRPFFVQAFYIPSESMEPTLLGHDPGHNLVTDVDHTDSVTTISSSTSWPTAWAIRSAATSSSSKRPKRPTAKTGTSGSRKKRIS